MIHKNWIKNKPFAFPNQLLIWMQPTTISGSFSAPCITKSSGVIETRRPCRFTVIVLPFNSSRSSIDYKSFNKKLPWPLKKFWNADLKSSNDINPSFCGSSALTMLFTSYSIIIIAFENANHWLHPGYFWFMRIVVFLFWRWCVKPLKSISELFNRDIAVMSIV